MGICCHYGDWKTSLKDLFPVFFYENLHQVSKMYIVLYRDQKFQNDSGFFPEPKIWLRFLAPALVQKFNIVFDCKVLQLKMSKCEHSSSIKLITYVSFFVCDKWLNGSCLIVKEGTAELHQKFGSGASQKSSVPDSSGSANWKIKYSYTFSNVCWKYYMKAEIFIKEMKRMYTTTKKCLKK